MTITNEMIEAACATYYDAEPAWKLLSEAMRESAKQVMRRALEAAEALRPKMVEVGSMADAPYIDVDWRDVDFAANLPVGTKLYAEQPK